MGSINSRNKAFVRSRYRAAVWLRQVAAWAVPVGFLFSALIYAHALHPLRMTEFSKDPSAQMHGWAQFASEVDAVAS